MATHPSGMPLRLDEAELNRIYMALLSLPEPRLEQLTEALGSELVPGALEVLADRGLVILREEGQIDVPSPDIALATFAANLEKQASLVRASTRGLTDYYNESRNQVRGLVESANLRLLRPEELIPAGTAILLQAESSVLAMRRGTQERLRHDVSELPELDYAAGVTRLTVVAPRVLDSKATLQVLQRRLTAGDDVRVHPELPFNAVVVDDRVAVLQIPSTTGENPVALILRSPPAARALAGLIRLVHGHGTPLPGNPLRTGFDPMLDDRDRLLLALLASGTSDSTIARELGVSLRTVERGVRRILDHLGARSRFQAGVEAYRRGLV